MKLSTLKRLAALGVAGVVIPGTVLLCVTHELGLRQSWTGAPSTVSAFSMGDDRMLLSWNKHVFLVDWSAPYVAELTSTGSEGLVLGPLVIWRRDFMGSLLSKAKESEGSGQFVASDCLELRYKHLGAIRVPQRPPSPSKLCKMLDDSSTLEMPPVRTTTATSSVHQ
jgi:hypothetical protein